MQATEQLLANDYKVNFVQSYTQMANFSARLRQYEGLLEKASTNASRVISDKDEMMHGKFNTDEVYMSVGRSALHLSISALIANDLDTPKTILDLPCGHGREARFFCAAFPQAEIYGCDVNIDGLNFCKENFAMHAVESMVDLSQLSFPTKFDLIWCGSLLTHLDATRATQLLDKFADYLNPGGLMLFSSHGRMHANFVHDRCFKLTSDELFEKVKSDYLRLGYGYAEYPGVPNFGLSLTSPGWIFNYVYGRNDLVLSSFAEKAWHGLHDVSVIQKVKLDQYLYPSDNATSA